MRVGRDVKVFDFGGWMDECDAGFSVTSLSRPAYEGVLRKRVAALPGVTIRSEADVRRFAVEGGRCTGVELADGMKLAADLVVDSTGMTAPLMRQLVEDGHAEFETEEIRINVAYTTARFRKPEKCRDEKIGFFFLPAPPEKHFGFILPIENGEWIISLGTRGHDAPPRDVAALKEYARNCSIRRSTTASRTPRRWATSGRSGKPPRRGARSGRPRNGPTGCFPWATR